MNDPVHVPADPLAEVEPEQRRQRTNHEHSRRAADLAVPRYLEDVLTTELPAWQSTLGQPAADPCALDDFSDRPRCARPSARLEPTCPSGSETPSNLASSSYGCQVDQRSTSVAMGQIFAKSPPMIISAVIRSIAASPVVVATTINGPESILYSR